MPQSPAFEKFIKEKKLPVIYNKPLAPFTTLKIGGSAKYFIEPHSAEELSLVLKAASECDIPIYILGAGSNILIRDAGIDGVVVRTSKFKTCEFSDTHIKVGCGYGLAKLINEAMAKGLAGLEAITGIPASIGGAVTMNAGGKFGEIAQFVKSVDAIKLTGETLRLQKADAKFSYRHSIFSTPQGKVTPDLIVFGAELELKRKDKKDIVENYKIVIGDKKATQPLGSPNVGCIFKNPSKENSAGSLIDKAGLKGYRYGKAHISRKHANFIINEGGATSSDIFKLVEIAQAKVAKEFKVDLVPEIIVW